MNREPTVLDYVKSLLRGKPLAIPSLEEAPESPKPAVEPAQAPIETPAETPVQSTPLMPKTPGVTLPWRSLLALGLALAAQISLQPGPDRTWLPGVILYVLAAGWLVWSTWKGEWSAAALPEVVTQAEDYRVRARWLYISLPLALAAFLTLGGNLFTPLNVTLWILSTIFIILAFWQGNLPFKGWWSWLKAHLRLPWKPSISAWTLLVLATAFLVVFFRVYRISQVPPEMVSDHAEKLLDIWDVTHGQTHIFFPRNTGREAIQMYLTAGIMDLLHTGYSYLSLKIGTILVGLLTLPYLYLLGKELGSSRVGLFAMLFAGIAYWPNVISRVGLRFPLYPLFVAPTLYYLLRGMRTSRRNDFILAGLALGIGLHGYTPIRILPLVVLVAVGLYLLHPQARGKRMQTVSGLLVLILVSLILFLPLLRFALDYPTIFDLRAFSRLGTTERPLPGPALIIFLKNLWNASTMYFWSDGNIWVHSVTGSPALDFISGALYFLGVVLLLIRYIRQRTWQDLLILLAVPLLMLPSILSLAFPDENPALNRAAGAIVPVFLIVAIALDGLMSAVEKRTPSWSGSLLAGGLAILLIFISCLANYDLVFNQYQRSYELSSWNTSEMGRVVRDFGEMYGSTETAYVVPYPYWVDTRLVGMNAGDPTRDYAIPPDQISQTLNDPRPKMFLVNLDDQTDLDLLRQLFPQGSLATYPSQVGKNFDIYMVPSASSISSGSAVP
ncbi:MAG TPA: glycosyltransferase family 39 protein [Anaerolineales bacterium]|nr:glycosyltransferase family 39 protein [Anaerolineales bacterium]